MKNINFYFPSLLILIFLFSGCSHNRNIAETNQDPFENLMRIGADSGGKEKGNSFYTNQVPFDLLGIERPNPSELASDLGAYQHIIFVD